MKSKYTCVDFVCAWNVNQLLEIGETHFLGRLRRPMIVIQEVIICVVKIQWKTRNQHKMSTTQKL